MDTKYCKLIGTQERIDKFIGSLPCSIDRLVELVESTLDMWPNYINISVYLYDTVRDVQRRYYELHQQNCGQKAFWKKGMKAMYVAVEDCDTEIVIHQLGHLILETKYPNFPAKFHEDFAKYCVRNVVIR